MQGELQQAAQLYRWVFSELESNPLDRDQTLLRRGRALAGLAALALEWNDWRQPKTCYPRRRRWAMRLALNAFGA